MKKFNIFLMAAFLITALVFAFSASGRESEYINNYAKNFKTNLYVISKKMGLPENVAKAVPTPDVAALFTPTPMPTNTPAPPFESHRKGMILAADKSVMIPVQNSANMEFVSCGDYLVGLDKTTINFFGKKGQAVHTGTVQLSTPVLRTAGNYILAVDRGGKKVYLYDGTKEVFCIDADNSIICADVSENGDVVLVCEKDFYKGCVVVYNKRGELVYVWNSGSDRIMDADISGQSRQLAVVTMSLDNNEITSNVLWCDIGKEKTETVAQYKGTLVYDAEFSGNMLFVAGDDKIAGIGASGKAEWEVPLGDASLKRYDIGKVMAGVFDIENLPYIELYNQSGKKKSSIKLNIQPDCMDMKESLVAYNEERTLVVSDTAGKESKRFSCMRDISDIILMSADTAAVVYSSSIEFVNIK